MLKTQNMANIFGQKKRGINMKPESSMGERPIDATEDYMSNC